MHEAGERRNKNHVTGRSFYCKNNLKFKGRNRNLNRSRNRGKKIGTRNRNLGKMARFHNTVGDDAIFTDFNVDIFLKRVYTSIVNN
jgi:hypothetical protein